MSGAVLNESRSSPTATARLIYALTGGVVWWIVHLVVVSALTPAACAHRLRWVMYLVSGVTAALTLTAVAAARSLRRDPSPVAVASGRSRFLGDVALAFNAISLALIVLETIPIGFVHPCR